jgi:hypothetical protein
MNNRVKGSNAAQLSRSKRQRQHVSLEEKNLWIALSRLRQRFPRKVQSNCVGIELPHVACNMTRPAAQITDDAAITVPFREPLQQIALFGPVIELIGDVFRVLLSQRIVTGADLRYSVVSPCGHLSDSAKLTIKLEPEKRPVGTSGRNP